MHHGCSANRAARATQALDASLPVDAPVEAVFGGDRAAGGVKQIFAVKGTVGDGGLRGGGGAGDGADERQDESEAGATEARHAG